MVWFHCRETDSVDTAGGGDQNTGAGLNDSADNGTSMAVIRTLVLMYTSLASLQSGTLSLLTLALVWW